MPSSRPTRAAFSRLPCRAWRGRLPGPCARGRPRGSRAGPQRDREACVQELVRARVPRRHDGSGHGRGREQADDDGPGRSCVAPHYFLYGRPSAAGGIERPITPATAISVSTYGSAWKSTAAESEYSGRRCASALEKPNRRRRRSAARPPVAEDHRGERDEPAPGRHVLVEGVDEADREERAAGAASMPEMTTAAVADAVDGDPDRVGGPRVLAARRAAAGRAAS